MNGLREALPRLAREVSDEELARIEADARRKAKPPKPRTQKVADEGYYNALVLDEPAATLASVVEGKDEKAVECVLEGRRVRKLSGPFAPPVTVTYITQSEQERYHEELLALVQKALQRR